jgi:DME family drug/metabolite transporter
MAGRLTRFHAFTLLASAVWGTSFPAMKYLLASVDPYTLGGLRIGLAGIFGIPLLLRVRPRPRALFLDRDVWALVLLNALAVTLLHVGVDQTTASKTSLIINVNIVFVAIASFWILKETLHRTQAAGIGLGLAGVLLVTTGGDLTSAQGGEILGDALVFASAILAALSIVLTKRLLVRYDFVSLGVGALLMMSLALIPPAVLLGRPASLAPIGWGVVVWAAGVSTLFASLLWTLGLRGVTATVSSLLLAVQVLVAAGLSLALLEEPLTFTFVVGTLLILGAVHLASIERGPPRGNGSGSYASGRT